MRKLKRKHKIFFRSMIMTAVVLICIAAVFLGICRCYEEIKRISFTKDLPAVYLCDEYIRILDFKIDFK